MEVISDTHIGGDEFVGAIKDHLPNYLKQFAKPETLTHTLVLAGDIIDVWWDANFTEETPTVVEFLRSKNYRGVDISSYVQIFKDIIANGVDIIYVRGNHDDLVVKEDFDQVGLSEIKFVEVSTIIGNIKIEHGNQYDLFNAPDPAGTIKPLGYFLTRAYEQGPRSREKEQALKEGRVDISASNIMYWACRNIVTYAVEYLGNAEWFIERAFGGLLEKSVWSIAANKAFKKHQHDWLREGCVYKDGCEREEPEQLKHILRKYKSVMQRFIDTYGVQYTQNMLRGACHNTDYFVKKQPEPVDLLIMGHTHGSLLKSLKKDSGDGYIVYGNTGHWSIHEEYLPVIRVTMKDKKTASHVALIDWNELTEKYITLHEANIPYNPKSNQLEILDRQFPKATRIEYLPEQTPKVPEGWTCDPVFYGSNDGCDCDCGIWDPDCGPETSTCVSNCKTIKYN